MRLIFEPPTNLFLGAMLVPIALAAGARGAWLFARGLREADHPAGPFSIIRGLRGLTAALGLAALSAGVLLAEKGLLAFGAVFLGEELYETSFLLLILCSGREDVSDADSRARRLEPTES